MVGIQKTKVGVAGTPSLLLSVRKLPCPSTWAGAEARIRHRHHSGFASALDLRCSDRSIMKFRQVSGPCGLCKEFLKFASLQFSFKPHCICNHPHLPDFGLVSRPDPPLALATDIHAKSLASVNHFTVEPASTAQVHLANADIQELPEQGPNSVRIDTRTR